MYFFTNSLCTLSLLKIKKTIFRKYWNIFWSAQTLISLALYVQFRNLIVTSFAHKHDHSVKVKPPLYNHLRRVDSIDEPGEQSTVVFA